jgi:hypothetical protein
MIDRKTVLEHLAHAEQHAIEGAARIERLETMIADLDRKGRDIRDAKAILATMRVTQTHNEGDCLSLLKQLQRYTEPSRIDSRTFGDGYLCLSLNETAAQSALYFRGSVENQQVFDSGYSAASWSLSAGK